MSIVNPSGNGDIDGVLWGYRWDSTSLTYAFPTTTASYGGYTSVNGFESFNATQQAGIVKILQNISSFSGLTFTLGNAATATLRYAEAASINYGQGVTSITTAQGHPPDPSFIPDFAQGDMWFNKTSYNSPTTDSYAYAAGLMHETGHALGLKHGHAAQVGHGVTFPALPANHNSYEYSVMTYSQYVGDSGNIDDAVNHPTTYMQDDIAALQYMYGANFSTNSGTTIYRWNPATGEMSINGVGQGAASSGKILMTLWDGGGTDTYDLSLYGNGVTVDLRPGGWTTTSSTQIANLGSSSNVHLARGNIANALQYNGDTRSLIENVIGGSGNDTIIGNAADNVLNGGSGADTMVGGAGNDTFVVDNIGDVASENAGEGSDTVNASVTYTLGVNLENLNLLGSSNINGTGNSAANTLVGNAGNNVLDGGGGADMMIGGAGNDTYFVDVAGDGVSENAGEGSDTVNASVTYTLGANIENLSLLGSANLNGTGNSGANTLIGNAGNNFLDGGAGADTMIGGIGNDTYFVDVAGDVVIENAGEGTDTVNASFTYTLGANVESLSLLGSLNINGTGNSGANTLVGNAGNNFLDGAAGVDTLIGGAGNDTYFLDVAGDAVIEFAGEGVDTVNAAFSYALGANLENLTLLGSANLNGMGNGGANTLIGNAGNNLLDGATGADTLIGGAGNDTYNVDVAGDVAIENVGEGTDTVNASVSYTLGANLENLALSGTANLAGTGNALANVLTGNSGDNSLDGAAGADTMIGGAGNDTYTVDNAGDVVVENAAEGTWDVVLSSVNYTLSANVETLVLGGAATNGTGNAGNNYLIGNGADNVLDGGAGADTMIGGAGNDTYTVDNAGDYIAENAAEGTWDVVLSSVNYTLSANVETLVLGGVVTNGTGNAGNNYLIGNGADNVLDGAAGADTMIGGAGNDTYTVDNAGDYIVENANEGTWDVVLSSVDYTLSANVETLVLGGGAIRGTGHAGNNYLIGNGADNVLDGGAGADTMIGGAGNDTYTVDNAGDYIAENAAEGTWDVVLSSVNYTLSANVETLVLGGVVTNGTGNAGNNYLIGNGADNVLDGAAGADTMIGGAGNDTYTVDNAGDYIVENAAEGTWDVVLSSVNYTLSANVETLVLGGVVTNGTGNAGNNYLIGNAANNLLDGAAGADTMIGGAGNDSYTVDNAADVVVENVGEGTWDVVTTSVDYTLSANVETLVLGGTVVRGTGNAGNNYLIGNVANNILDGAAGADTMIGGAGNDSYTVDNSGDNVVENAGEGGDTVNASISYILGANVENLSLTGAAALAGTGNSQANLITGNSGNNSLDGRAGVDTLFGGLGDDIFIFRRGEANGDVLGDFAGNGSSAGDQFQFQGYGTVGATFTQVDAMRWSINSSDNTVHDIITLSNSASIHASDYFFV